MHAHLRPVQPDDGTSPPDGSTASCRLDAGDGSGWLLCLTDGAIGDYQVEDLWGRPDGSGAWAQLVEFDGPRDAAQVAADRRSGRDRVWPAASQVDGTLGALVLRAPDGAMAVVAFADSRSSLEASDRAIMSTPLLPGEDPALLHGPDRSAVYRVHDDGVTDVLRAAATSTPVTA